MSIDIKVPAMGESVTEATVARWFKKEGDAVAAGDTLVELETDKITVEVPALSAGVLTKQGRRTSDLSWCVRQVDEVTKLAKVAEFGACVLCRQALAR